MAGPGPGPLAVPEPGRRDGPGQPVSVLRRPERERVRRLQRGGMRGCQLAAQLRLLDLRH